MHLGQPKRRKQIQKLRRYLHYPEERNQAKTGPRVQSELKEIPAKQSSLRGSDYPPSLQEIGAETVLPHYGQIRGLHAYHPRTDELPILLKDHRSDRHSDSEYAPEDPRVWVRLQ